MLAVIAAILFALGLVLKITSPAPGVVISPTSLLLAGLACLALHVAGIGTGWGSQQWESARVAAPHAGRTAPPATPLGRSRPP